MSIIEKPDLRPLCDVHLTAMSLCRYRGKVGRSEFSAYACQEPGCDRAYWHGQGYCEFPENGPAESVRFEQCPECFTTLYLSRVDPLTKSQTWLCGQLDCNGSEERTIAEIDTSL